MTIARPKRFLPEKECDRCKAVKPASEFQRVRGGGTTDICATCRNAAVSAAMIAHHASHQKAIDKQQADHFAESLRRAQERWDSLPDGHPYKAPRRPGSE